MKLSNKTKSIALFTAIVIVVSAATSYATNYVSNKKKGVEFQTTSDQTLSAQARFASASSAMETDFTVAADLTVHAVVYIKTKAMVSQQQQNFFNDPLFDFFFGPQQGQRQQNNTPKQEVPKGAGSGVIISQDGYIVTNNHVIDDASDIEVTLNDKRTFKAKLIGADPSTDLALLKIDANDLQAITIGNSDNVKVGEWVLAVGNPFNLSSTVTAGIVSAKARNIGIIGQNNFGEPQSNNMSIESFIQTDAAINPGNSGGALVNTRGELIGINTAIASGNGVYNGYGFAIPSSIVSKVVTDLRQHGAVQRALLGVSIQDLSTEVAKEKNIKTLEGALVADVVSDGAADKAGIKTNDVINEINGVKVKSVAELQEQVGRYRPGDKVTVGLMRENKPMKLTAQLINADGNTDMVSSSTVDSDLGATLKPVDNKIKKALGIDYGLTVESVTKGALYNQGIRQGYIILKINNQPMETMKDFKEVYNEALKKDKKLYIAGVYPTTGKVAYYEIKLDK
ncbi:MAG TPA: Do family serine endopeptidase [Paludibacteraceae bacterium]|nr:Do family serine endopeptidase [Paludibacteraceae bacterium]HPT43281.1 Do family serine endopeptidase [Paludibacteraceae bacterium]